MTNLIQRLRDWDLGDDHTGQRLLMEAADELEQLEFDLDEARSHAVIYEQQWEAGRAEIERLTRERDEAEKLADMADKLADMTRERDEALNELQLEPLEKRAREAIKEKKHD